MNGDPKGGDAKIREISAHARRPIFYANHVSVMASGFEVVLKFGLIREQEGTVTMVEPVADLYLAKPVADALRSVLERTLAPAPSQPVGVA